MHIFFRLKYFLIKIILNYSLRKECEKKKKELFPNSDDKRFIFIPVDWRSSLVNNEKIQKKISLILRENSILIHILDIR